MAKKTAKKAAPIIRSVVQNEEPRLYEVCILYPSSLPQKEEAATYKEVDVVFEEAKAELVEKDEWGLRGLAYTIKGNNQGKFVVYYFNILPSHIKEMDTNLRLTKNVLRHIIVKPPKGYKIESYAAKFEQWKKNKKLEDEQVAQKKEDAIRKKVAERAKRNVKSTKKVAEQAVEIDEKKVNKQLDKLIADDDLEL